MGYDPSMGSRTANRTAPGTDEKRRALRSVSKTYFSPGPLSNRPIQTASPTYEPDRVSFETKLKMRKDPIIALGLWTIKAPISTSDFVINCDDPVITAFVRETMYPLWSRLMRTSLKMLDFGWQPHELVYSVEDVDISFRDNRNREDTSKPAEQKRINLQNMVTLKEIKDINPSTCDPLYHTVHDEFIGIQQRQGGEKGTVEISKDRLYISTHNQEWGDIQGHSLLDQAYRPWYYAFAVEQLWARFMERRTIPPLVGTGPTGTRSDADGNEFNTEDLMLTVLNNLHHGNGAYLPFEPDSITRKNQWSIDALQFFSQTDQFQTFLATMDAHMLRGLLIPEKVIIQGVKVGTLSETEQFTDTFLVGLDALLFEMEVWINKQIVAPMVRLNFVNPPKCELKISQITSQRRAAMKDLVSLLSDATDINGEGVQYKFADRLDFDSLAKQFGLPLKRPDDVLLRKEEDNGADDQSRDTGSPVPTESRAATPR